jgi:integrase
VLSVLNGARTEELRALTWDHTGIRCSKCGHVYPLYDETCDPCGLSLDAAGVPFIEVWRSVREHGDTKTKKSRRTLALPRRSRDALRAHWLRQQEARAQASDLWQDTGIVFATAIGTELDAGAVRSAFRRVVKRIGLDPADWTPRELRHSFVSILSDNGVGIEAIADLCGHSGTTVTETVYRHQLRPVLLSGAVAMDRIFDLDPSKPPGGDDPDDAGKRPADR